jgi:hypothetical protein
MGNTGRASPEGNAAMQYQCPGKNPGIDRREKVCGVAFTSSGNFK